MRQEELALRVGIGTSSLRLLEAGGSHGPSVYTVLKLFAVLEIDVSALNNAKPVPK